MEKNVHEFKKIQGKKVESRFTLIKKYIEGKDVLDCGAIDPAFIETDRWLHKKLLKYSKSVTGVDLSKNEIERVGEKYDIIHGNVEDINLNRKFDIIVAGDIIEHLSNPGKFLNNMKKHMKENACIIITTPNALMFNQFFNTYLFNGYVINNEHSCIFDEITLKQLLRRHGYDVIEIAYSEETVASFKHKVLDFISNFKPVLCETLIIVARLR